MKKLALMFYSVLKMPIDDIIACSVAAEKAGFSHISVAESFYRDGFALASVIAANTRKIKLGTSVMPIYTRTPFQLAMGTATLQELSNDRVAFLGLGIGYRSRAEQYFGIKQEQRLERMGEYVEIIRRLLSGTDTTFKGQLFNFKEFPRLVPFPLDIPIYFGSTAPRMLRLAGQVADGVILNSISTPAYVRFAKRMIAEGARSVGRDPSKIEIGHTIIFAVADDLQEAINAAKEDILFYISYPELNPILEKSRFKAEVTKMRGLYDVGDKKGALSLITDDMLDVFSVYGTPEQCKAKLSEFVKRGVTLPILRVSVAPYEVSERKNVFMKAIDSMRN